MVCNILPLLDVFLLTRYNNGIILGRNYSFNGDISANPNNSGSGCQHVNNVNHYTLNMVYNGLLITATLESIDFLEIG